ncbi:MAG: type II toxin-antitoxin system PemK/MazF family toxin [Nanoarchaeota archaeon]
MNIKQCDIVILPVPFSNQSTTKVRPAIVISNDESNNTNEDVILVPITSVLRNVPHSIMITEKNLSDGKLLVTSRIRADKPFVAHKSLIRIKVGSVKPEILKAIKDEINKLI